MEAVIALLPGDGIGPEVVAAARLILETVGQRYQHSFSLAEHPIGGIAIDDSGSPLPEATLQACRQADAVLLGAVGGPKWDDPQAAVRPEQGLLGLRQSLDLYANLRPVRPHPALLNSSPVKPERLAGVDLLVVRELTAGIYFGTPRLRRQLGDQVEAVDTMTYTEEQIRRVAQTAFQVAASRRGRVTSIDKANVLECSRLWRQTVEKVAKEFPQVQVEHILVDAAAMYLINRPASFDVLLTANLFGDILTDEASVLSGSMGNLPSASLGSETNRFGLPRGVYEPIHGSAPDIAGRGIANPIGTILSTSMLLRYSLGLDQEAAAIEQAVDQVLSAGFRTADLVESGAPAQNTAEMTAAILARIPAKKEAFA